MAVNRVGNLIYDDDGYICVEKDTSDVPFPGVTAYKILDSHTLPDLTTRAGRLWLKLANTVACNSATFAFWLKKTDAAAGTMVELCYTSVDPPEPTDFIRKLKIEWNGSQIVLTHEDGATATGSTHVDLSIWTFIAVTLAPDGARLFVGSSQETQIQYSAAFLIQPLILFRTRMFSTPPTGAISAIWFGEDISNPGVGQNVAVTNVRIDNTPRTFEELKVWAGMSKPFEVPARLLVE